MATATRLSIAANVALAAAVGLLLWRGHPPLAVRPDAQPQTTATPGRPRDPARPAAVLRPRCDGPALTSDAVTALEHMGISRDAIADAVIDAHTYRYDKRVRALQKKYAPKLVPRREMLAMAREAEAERVRELKESLGEEQYRAWDKDTTLRRVNLGGVRLEPAVAEAAYQLQKNFEAKDRALHQAMEDGVADEADTQALYAQAQRQLDQAMEKLVGRERLAAMRATPDPVVSVQHRFEELNPTPEQARAVLQTESDLHAREAALVQRMKTEPVPDANLAAELKTLTDARREGLRQIFGAAAYDAAQQQTDPTYQKLQQFSGAWDLPPAQIQPVYALLSALHDQADQSRMAAEMSAAAGQPVNWHTVNAGIAQSRRQTEAALAQLVGGEQVRRIEQNGLLDLQ